MAKIIQNNNEANVCVDERPVVLMADDDPIVRQMGCAALGAAGFRVLVFDNGADALESCAKEIPDIILLDVMMPEMDGFEVCTQIRAADGPLREKPVLLITGLDEVESLRKGYEVGVTDIATKPINWLIFSHRIRFMLRAGMYAQELRSSRAQLETAQKIAHIGSWEWDSIEKKMRWSNEVYTILGINSADFPKPDMGLLLNAVHPKDVGDVDRFLHSVSWGSNVEPLEHRIVRSDGSIRFIRHRAMPDTPETGWSVGTLQDITSEIELEHQLAQTQKMQALGALSAGIAHEINNPMGFISWNLNRMEEYVADVGIFCGQAAELARKAVSSEIDPLGGWKLCLERYSEKDVEFIIEDLANIVVECKEGASRIQTILRDMKHLSHPSDNEWTSVDIHQCLDSTINIIWNQLKYRCKVVKDYGELPEVVCRPQKLNQVFMNLLVNASQAMIEEGTLTVRTRADGAVVSIEISDTGVGIPDEIKPKLFESFFTTKPLGEGTGLGLHITQQIIREHGGEIQLESEVGKGTTFRIILPVFPPDSESQQDGKH